MLVETFCNDALGQPLWKSVGHQCGLPPTKILSSNDGRLNSNHQHVGYVYVYPPWRGERGCPSPAGVRAHSNRILYSSVFATRPDRERIGPAFRRILAREGIYYRASLAMTGGTRFSVELLADDKTVSHEIVSQSPCDKRATLNVRNEVPGAPTE